MAIAVNDATAIIGITAKRRRFLYTQPVAHPLDALFFFLQVGILFFFR